MGHLKVLDPYSFSKIVHNVGYWNDDPKALSQDKIPLCGLKCVMVMCKTCACQFYH